jgi:T5orf172 domain-containing protein
MNKCNKCNNEFKNKYNLEKHLNKKLSCIKEIIKCNYCLKEFNTNQILNRHMNKKNKCIKLNLENDNLEQEIKKIINKLEINNIQIKNEFKNEIEYIYLLKDRTSIELNNNIFKIGKTKQENLKRFNGYQKGFKIILLIKCNNCNDIESKIINKFKIKYIQCNDYGTEYFEGNYLQMIIDITEIILYNK